MNAPLVSVLTPTVPARAGMLEELVRSVQAQTDDRYEHIVQVDEEGVGCSITMNRAASIAKGEWLLPISDDDLLLPGCLATLTPYVDEADVIYAPPLVTGNEDRWWFFQAPPVIPSFGLIRRSLWDQIGGYDESVLREEDRIFWTAAVAAGARFLRIDKPCWVYRQHESNKSFVKAAA